MAAAAGGIGFGWRSSLVELEEDCAGREVVGDPGSEQEERENQLSDLSLQVDRLARAAMDPISDRVPKQKGEFTQFCFNFGKLDLDNVTRKQTLQFIHQII